MKKLLILVFSFTTLLTAYPPAGTFHDIAVDFQGTFSSLERLVFDTCQPTYINQTNVGTTGVLLGSGIFKLSGNIEFAPSTAANAITLTSDDAMLDLQSFAITQINAQSGVNGIQVNPSLSNITIKNGSVNNCTNAGIRIAEGNQEIAIARLNGVGNAQGILFDGTANNPISNSEVVGSELRNSTTAIEVSNTELTNFKSILALQSTQAGFDIRQSFTNFFQNTTINGVHSTSNAYGFKLENGGNNQILSNVITGISTSSTDTVNKAVGIEIGRYEESSQFGYNQISTIATLTAALAGGNAFGINMLYTFTALSNSGLPSQEYNQNEVSNPDPGVYSVAWFPDRQYLAIGQTQLTADNAIPTLLS